MFIIREDLISVDAASVDRLQECFKSVFCDKFRDNGIGHGEWSCVVVSLINTRTSPSCKFEM